MKTAELITFNYSTNVALRISNVLGTYMKYFHGMDEAVEYCKLHHINLKDTVPKPID